MNNLLVESFNKELERLENFGEIIGTAIVKRNGLLISSRLPRDIDDRKLGALAATMFEAIETATSTLEGNQIRNLTVEYQDYQFVIMEVDANTILVSVFNLDANLGLIFIEIEESIKNIRKTIHRWFCILTKEQKERYSRQIISPLIGEEGQDIISKIKVLQIGAGGLGSPFSLYLTAAGINELTIIDNDVLDITNLQRQILYNESQIGEDKVKSAKEILSKLNSDVRINTYKDYINEISIKKYLKEKQYDFIVDCSDNFKTKFLVNNIAVENNLRCVIAGIKDFYGQIMTINPKQTACYQCVFSPIETSPDEGPLPVIGVSPGILGTLEALEVLKTALGLPNMENKILMVNLIDLRFNIIDIVKNKKCICSQWINRVKKNKSKFSKFWILFKKFSKFFTIVHIITSSFLTY